MLLIHRVIMTKTIRSGNRPSRRRRRSKPKRKVVDLDIITEIEVKTGIGLVVGAIEGETAEIGSRIGRRLEPAMFVGNKAISGRIAEYPRRMGSPEKEASNCSGYDFISIGPDDNINKYIEEKVVFDRAEEFV